MKIGWVGLAFVCVCGHGHAETRSNQEGDGGYALIGDLMEPGSQSGNAIDIYGDSVIVGAFGHLDYRGGAYICSQSTHPEMWDQVAALETLHTLPPGARFGYDVAMHDGMAVVTAPGLDEGRAFVFRSDSPNDWTTQVILQANHPSPNSFGISVAMNDTCIVIGDPGAGDGAGAIHVYPISGGEIVAPDFPIEVAGTMYAEGGSEFGTDVAVLGNTIAVGAPGPIHGPDGGGHVYIYELAADGTSVSLETSVSSATDPLSQFGISVSLSDTSSGPALAVGMPGMDLNAGEFGSVVIYRLLGGDGGWQTQETVVAEIPDNSDHFGTSVSIDNNLLVVGAPDASTTGSLNGVAYIYRYSPSSGSWTPEWMLNPTGDSRSGLFGAAVDVRSGLLAVGAPNAEGWMGTQSGYAVVYEEPSDDQWQNDPRLPYPIILNRSDLMHEAPLPSFGTTVAIKDDIALVSQPASRQVFPFRRQGAEGSPWVRLPVEVHAPVPNNPPLGFGQCIEMIDSFAIISDDEDNGNVHVYQDVSGIGENWQLIQTIPGNVGGGEFGAAMDTIQIGSVLWLAVGDPGNIFDNNNSGQVHMFSQVPGHGWVNRGGVVCPGYVSGWPSDFGCAVSLAESNSGKLLVAVGDSAGGDDNAAGRVDIFEYDGFFNHQQTILPDNEWGLLFGQSVAITNDLLVVGSNSVNQRGHAKVYKRSTPLRGRTDLWTDYYFSWTLQSTASPTAGTEDDFANQVAILEAPPRILVSAPGLDYTNFNAGGVYVFAPAPDEFSAWNIDSLLCSAATQANDRSGPFAIDGETVLVGCPGDGLGLPQRVLDFELTNSVSWMWMGGGFMSSTYNWSGDPSNAKGRFALMLADWYIMNFDIDVWNGSIEVAFNDVIFDLIGGLRQIGGDMSIQSPSYLKMPIVDVTNGTLQIDGSLHIGPAVGAFYTYGEVGQLRISSAEVVAQQSANISPQSVLSLELIPSMGRSMDDPHDEPGAMLSTGAFYADGTLSITATDASEFQIDQQFVLLESTSQPTLGTFDAIVLPGLPNDLAFQLSTTPGLRGGSGDAVVATVVSLAGLLDFGDPNSVVVSGDATAVEVVDLNGDSAEEICVTFAGTPGQLVIFENDGAGGVAQQIIVSTGDDPVDISSGDFNADGTNDLAVANNLSQDVTIYYNDDNDPSNGFDLLDIDVDGPPTCLAGISANGDSYGDLAVGLDDTDGDGNGYWVIYVGSDSLRMPGGMGEGGGLVPSGVPLGADPADEEDQKDYLFAGRMSDGKTSVVKNDTVAAGGLTLVADDYVTGADAAGLTTGDLDGDGQADLAVTSRTNGTIAILLQDTSGSADPGDFLPAIYIPVGNEPGVITSVDFDNDGHRDLATVVTDSMGDRLVRVLQGNSALSFTTLDTAEGEAVVLVDAGDVAGDGNSELVTIGGAAALRGAGVPLLTLREVDQPSCPGDFDGNGEVGIDDILALLGEFGSDCTSGCQTDTDGDGDVDIDDMLAVIGAFGPCR